MNSLIMGHCVAKGLLPLIKTVIGPLVEWIYLYRLEIYDPGKGREHAFNNSINLFQEK